MTRSGLLYKQNYVDKDFERLDLFVLLKERYSIRSALYPGSYIHLTPSFVFPVTVYADTDKRARRFFADPWTRQVVEERKLYAETPTIRFHPRDFTDDLPEESGSFDLLISQWAGFVSTHCKAYLKPGGLLLANDSHGDASMASIDDDYRFIAAVALRSGKYRLIEKDLARYFVPKSDIEITPEYLSKTRRGVGYRKTAWAYLFREVGIRKPAARRTVPPSLS
jgi:hypothetical protein